MTDPEATLGAEARQEHLRKASMSPLIVGLITFFCTFGGALLGLRMRRALPENAVSGDSRDSIKAIIGVVATMAALVLGLVTASAKASFDTFDTAVKQTAIDLLMLDRELVGMGPEAKEIRVRLKQMVEARVVTVWPETPAKSVMTPAASSMAAVEGLVDTLRGLSPGSELQRAHQLRAVELAQHLLETRWLLATSPAAEVPMAFLVVLIFWVAMTLFFFGLCSPPNPATVAVLCICSISVASAVLLVIDFGSPFAGGFITVSPEPLHRALELMNK
jgi:hypothetical protein